ncbi:IS66 family transposase, partial [Thiolapillus sp.]|uniref:IS66 family transposase n=1 Tax=Thiolapillus sp. TaxID=2017437 RepID=UPI003AF73859
MTGSPAQVAALQAEIQSLKTQLDWFKKQLFGQKPEKRLIEPNPDQGALFDRLAPEEETATPTEKITYTRRKGKKQRDEDCATDQGLRFDGDVPIERIELSPAGLNDQNRDQYEIIGEKITRRLAQQPGSYVVLEYVRPVLKHKPSQVLATVPAPTAIFEGCMADVSVLAGLLVDKFVYHLPLYRQHQRMKDAGITVAHSTLTQWVQKTLALLEPIAEAQKRHILQRKVLAMDETPIKAGRKKKGKMQSTWFWPLYGEDDELAFTWSKSRGTAHVEQALENFHGTLLTDGYARNKPWITQAQCWAHTRRYFIKAEALEPEAVAQALDFIGKLYAIEADIRDHHLDREQCLKQRLTQSKPRVDQFFAWCHEQSQRTDLVNSNPLAKALTYVRNHQEQLQV